MGTNENSKNIPISHGMTFKERENLREYKKRKMMKNKRMNKKGFPGKKMREKYFVRKFRKTN